ncbi:cytoskeletal protein RodZ [Endozoicomonas sp. NE40]|uniref:Cytoskeletal protein RodZ n=1 Tax=Endozoicomonas lisbonensis TaxID=3120522 RepID=A0ABV2SAM5_9GAMM
MAKKQKRCVRCGFPVYRGSKPILSHSLKHEYCNYCQELIDDSKYETYLNRTKDKKRFMLISIMLMAVVIVQLALWVIYLN